MPASPLQVKQRILARLLWQLKGLSFWRVLFSLHQCKPPQTKAISQELVFALQGLEEQLKLCRVLVAKELKNL